MILIDTVPVNHVLSSFRKGVIKRAWNVKRFVVAWILKTENFNPAEAGGVEILTLIM